MSDNKKDWETFAQQNADELAELRARVQMVNEEFSKTQPTNFARALAMMKALDPSTPDYDDTDAVFHAQAAALEAERNRMKDVLNSITIEANAVRFLLNEETFRESDLHSLLLTIPTKSEEQMTIVQRIALTEQTMNEYGEQLVQYHAEDAAIRALTPESVQKSEALLDQVFVTAFRANDEPMLDYARLKMELKRLRRTHLTARTLLESLETPCVGCGRGFREPHADECRLGLWWEENAETALAAGLIPSSEKGATE